MDGKKKSTNVKIVVDVRMQHSVKRQTKIEQLV